MVVFRVLLGLTIASADARKHRHEPFKVQSVSQCRGSEVAEGRCEPQPECHSCTPKDCVLGEWSEWVDGGGCSGLLERHRTVKAYNNECGKPCSATLVDTKRFINPSCVSVAGKCNFGEWSAWSTCATPFSQRSRERSLKMPDGIDLGTPCEGETKQTEVCGTPYPAVNCTLGDWAPWTTCSATCDSGRKTRARRIRGDAEHGGSPCMDPLMQVADCNLQDCNARGPCEVSVWSQWVGCDATDPTQRERKRSILKASFQSDIPCGYALAETEGCPVVETVEPCLLSQWSSWIECDKTCGGGQQFRSRSSPGNGGACLPSDLEETQACNTQSCKTNSDLDCQLGPWSAWDECSVTCGVGETSRSRQVARAQKPGGEGCHGFLSEVGECKLDACLKGDCLWSEWQDWSSCTCSCDGGTQTRSRYVKATPRNGGKECDANTLSEVIPCNTRRCKEVDCVDGAWGAWSDWSGCSASCDFGYQTRYRPVATDANYCGEPLKGDKEEFVVCDLPECLLSVDCVLYDWSPWTKCSCDCYGHMTRTRDVKRYATGLGKPCSDNLAETTACNPGVLDGKFLPAPKECTAENKTQCTFLEWTAWNSCSATCGGGVQTRHRDVANQPCLLDPNAAAVSLLDTQPCGLEECGPGCVDCEWEEWQEWSACTKCGGQKVRHRHVSKYANYCGKPCKTRASQEVAGCPSHCEKEFYCTWSDWHSYGPCSATCGAASQQRSRNLLKIPFELTEESFNGTLPSYDYEKHFLMQVDDHSKCHASQNDITVCKIVDCVACTPVDCVLGHWSEWSPPSCEGLAVRHRNRLQEANACGKPCNGTLVRTKRETRNLECNVKVDCKFTMWSPWTHCGAGITQRTRTREATTPKFEGEACEGFLKETEPCGAAPAEKTNCKLSSWGPWSESSDCPLAIRDRTRYILTMASKGGEGCEGALKESEGFVPATCHDPPKLTCVLGDWSDWTTTSNGQRYRARSVDTEELQPGVVSEKDACTGSLRETAPGEDAIRDCVMSHWVEWDECDASCGAGQKQRHRQVHVLPDKRGKQCPQNIVDMAPCDAGPCPGIVDCLLSNWEEWSECSSSCDGGQQARVRSILHPASEHGVGCEDTTYEMRGCEEKPCVKDQDCKWGEWHEWEACSCSCGGGTTQRARHIAVFPSGAGAVCEALSKLEVQPCNTKECHGCVDGEWGLWTEWSMCSATCASGFSARYRHPTVVSNFCGQPVEGLDQEYRVCNDDVSCQPNVDCEWREWQEWNGCSATCDGLRHRSRHIAVQGSGHGKFCTGAADEVQNCDSSSACEGEAKVDCQWSEWNSWSSCSVTCGGGQYNRSRFVLVNASGGGKNCRGGFVEVAGCTREECANDDPKPACLESEWHEWGPCNPISGQKYRTRMACNGTAQEVAACTRSGGDTMYCTWGAWESWGVCDTTCGEGRRQRERQLTLSSVEPPDAKKLNEQLQIEAVHTRGDNLQELAVAYFGGAACCVFLLAVFKVVSSSCGRREGEARENMLERHPLME